MLSSKPKPLKGVLVAHAHVLMLGLRQKPLHDPVRLFLLSAFQLLPIEILGTDFLCQIAGIVL